MTVLILGDCLQEMKAVPDGSVDLVLTDLPYGVTNAEWDTALPFCDLWQEWRRVLRPYGCVVLFGTQPFITDVIQSNRREFSHVWYWKKNNIIGHLNAHREPMRRIEEVAVGETDMKNNCCLLMDIFCGLASFAWFLLCLVLIMVIFHYFFG